MSESFGVKHIECVGFDSRWVVKKVNLEKSQQTSIYELKDESNETNQRKEMETQTDTKEILSNVDFDIDKLNEFLKKIYPKVEEELKESISTKVFDTYKLKNEDDFKLLQNIEILSKKTTNDNNVKISSMSWNSSGKTLGVSLKYSHQTWCYDQGYIFLYTLDKNETLPSNPTRRINTDSCILNIKFHPTLPSILAGNSHNSEIFIWNIQNDEDNLILTKMNRINNISNLNWLILNHLTIDITFLVTSGFDGFLTLWKLNNSYTCSNIYERYKIKAPILSKSTKTTKNTDVGITCFDFSKHHQDLFIIGTENGLIIQCSTLKQTKVKGSTDLDPVYDPVNKYYEKHEAAITFIQICKEKPDLFMSGGMDFQIRIYMIGQEEPARKIFFNNFINQFYWVPHEKHLIFGIGEGNIEIYNIITGKIVGKNDKNDATSNNSNGVCLVNPTKHNFVVVGFENGCLELWKIPWGNYTKKSK